MTGDPKLAELIAEARRAVVFTGAGISTGSGIADYRGPDGVWKTREPVMFRDFMNSRAARVEYWDQKLETWPMIRDAAPNVAHCAIARWQAAGGVSAVITQNIDGLHEKAGCDLERLYELHGTQLAVECMDCHERTEPGPHFSSFAATRQPPECSACGGRLKPATISFGQSLRQRDLDRSVAAARGSDLMLVLGSSLSVHPAAGIPLLAVERGVPYVIINRGATEHDDLVGLTLKIDGDVTDVLPPVVDQALGRS